MKEYYESYGNWLKTKPPIEVTGVNPHFKNSYKELDVIIATVTEPLASLGFVFAQTIEANNVVTELYHLATGQSKVSAIPLNPELKAHEIGSQITYFRRYGLTTMLGYVTGKDDDGNAASGLSDKPKAPETKQPSEAERNKLKAALAAAITVDEIGKLENDFKKQFTLTGMMAGALEALVKQNIERLKNG